MWRKAAEMTDREVSGAEEEAEAVAVTQVPISVIWVTSSIYILNKKMLPDNRVDQMKSRNVRAIGHV